MAKTIRSACRNKHSENYDGFLADVLGKDVVRKIKAIESSKRYRKTYRAGYDEEAMIGYENEIRRLMGETNFEYYVG